MTVGRKACWLPLTTQTHTHTISIRTLVHPTSQIRFRLVGLCNRAQQRASHHQYRKANIAIPPISICHRRVAAANRSNPQQLVRQAITTYKIHSHKRPGAPELNANRRCGIVVASDDAVKPGFMRVRVRAAIEPARTHFAYVIIQASSARIFTLLNRRAHKAN